MAIPAQVLRGDAAADQLVQTTYASPDPAQPPAQDPVAAQPSPPTPTEPAPAPTPAQPSPDDAALWQQRYRSLQGMFDAEKRRSDAAVKDLQTQLAALTVKLEQLDRKPEPPAQAQASVTDKDVEAFGSDLIDLARRIAADSVGEVERRLQSSLAAKDAEIAELKKQVGGVQEQTAVVTRDAYYKALGDQIPNWRQVNEDQGFIDWLSGKDPLTAIEYQAYLASAFEQMDVARTAAIFRSWPGYKAEPTAPPVQPALTPQPQPRQPLSPQQELLRQVQPSTSQAAPQPMLDAGGPAKIWRNAEIEQFYADQTRGAYRGREDVAKRISDEIDLALQYGRVRP